MTEIKPMTEDFILWRCLHGGPHTGATLEDWSENETGWPTHRAINVPVLGKLMQTYGTCAMLAWDADRVVGFVRFYPTVLLSFQEAGGMCLQQSHPAGPSDRLVHRRFPPLDEIEDKQLTVHCAMTCRPYKDAAEGKKVGARQGIGQKLVKGLIEWARQHGWKRIVRRAHADLDCMYGIYGGGGKAFWEKAGFKVVGTRYGESPNDDEWKAIVESQAEAKGMSKEEAWTTFRMAYEL